MTQGLNPGLLYCRQILYHLSQLWEVTIGKMSGIKNGKRKMTFSPLTFRVDSRGFTDVQQV